MKDSGGVYGVGVELLVPIIVAVGVVYLLVRKPRKQPENTPDDREWMDAIK